VSVDTSASSAYAAGCGCVRSGTTVLWGFDKEQEVQVLSGILRAPRVTEGSFKDVDVEDDEFTVVYSTHQQPRIANDTIIMDRCELSFGERYTASRLWSGVV
jgi:uncharacterized Rmd1/YagE family protein